MKESKRFKELRGIALEILATKGYRAMTMRDIAKELECEVSNIYNHVKSKQVLLDKLLFEISNKFHDGMLDIESSSYGAMEKLKAVISMHIRLTIENPYQVQLLTNEWRHLVKDRQEEFIQLRNLYEQRLRSILKEGVKTGSFRIENIEFSMNCILSSIRWIYSWYSPSTKDEMNPLDIEKYMTQFIIRGIG